MTDADIKALKVLAERNAYPQDAAAIRAALAEIDAQRDKVQLLEHFAAERQKELDRLRDALRENDRLFEKLDEALAGPEEAAEMTREVGGFVSALNILTTADGIVGRACSAIAALRAEVADLRASMDDMASSYDWTLIERDRELAEVRAENADLRAKWDASVERGNVAAIDAMQREDVLRAEVADLRGRAIPKAWLSEAHIITLIADHDDRVETITRVVTPERNGWVYDADYHDGRPSKTSPAHPTLAGALRAAAESDHA